jgi:hypothetical protein
MATRATPIVPLLVALLALSVACTPRALVYVPDPGVPSTSVGRTRITLTEVQAPAEATGLGVVLDVEAPGALTITAAHAVPSGAKACDGDAPGALAAAVMSIDGQRQWQRPLRVEGRRAVTLEFALPPADSTHDADHRPALESVDVAFIAGAGPQCARVPLGTPDGRLVRVSPWSWGRSVRIEAPALDAYAGALRLGRWVGPLRLGGELGVGVRRCTSCLSPLYLAAPAALTLETIVATRTGLGVGVELAYAVRPTLGADAGDRYLLHGPRVTLRIISAAPRTFGLPGGPRRRFASFDLVFAHQVAAGVDHWAQTVFSLGWTWDRGF